MSYEIVLDTLPLGLAEHSARGGETATVQASGFASTEDGTKLVRWLEEIVTPLLSGAPPGLRPSQVDHLVALVRSDRSATIYVNEVAFINKVRPKRPLERGAPVYLDDIADIGPLRFDGIEVPADAGVIVFLSHGWRRGLFYDLSPLAPDRAPRGYELHDVLGSVWGYLAFQDRLHLTDQDWDGLTRHGWFPFVGLRARDVSRLVGHAAAGWDPDEVLPEIAEQLATRLPTLLSTAVERPVFANHQQNLERAVTHYTGRDYLSACALLYPRIEGIMRDRSKGLSEAPSFRQPALAEAAVSDPTGKRLSSSLLLAERFRRFINDVYFSSFDPKDASGVSRHTVSHGVAPEGEMNLKAATIAFLIVEQLVYLSSP